MFILGYIGAALMGITLGLIGAGGSILIVPIMVYLFKIPPSQATTYSLFIVGCSALIGAYKYYQKGDIRFDVVIQFSIPAFLGVYISRIYTIPAIPNIIFQDSSLELTKETLIMSVFAIVMLIASISTIQKRKTPDSSHGGAKVLWLIIGAFLTGNVTGFVGAGGGFLIIPALLFFAMLPIKKAIGTSLSIIAIKTLFGFFSTFQKSPLPVDWGFISILTSLSVVGIFVGSFLSTYIPGEKLKPAFGWFVLVMGTLIIAKQILG